jgi:hypothetical protein
LNQLEAEAFPVFEPVQCGGDAAEDGRGGVRAAEANKRGSVLDMLWG